MTACRPRRPSAFSSSAWASCSFAATRGDARALLLVATIATTIAAYTLVDREGIQHAGALTYFVLTLAGPCLVYPPLVGLRAMRREINAETIAAGVANLGSYSLAMLAQRHGPFSPCGRCPW